MPPIGFIIRKSAAISGLLLLGLLAILLVLALLPVDTSDLVSSPDPATSYADSVARIQAVLDDEAGKVCDICGTRFLTHGDKTAKAVVLIHGLTNSPRQFWELGQRLYDDGYNVLIPRMPYHGLRTHTVSELANTRPGDLSRFGDQTADIAAGIGEEVTVVGLSGGGTIAAWIGQNRSDMDKTVLIAPLFGLYGVPPFADPLLGNLFSRLPDIVVSSSSEPPRDSVYLGWSSRGVAEYLLLAKETGRQIGASPPGVKHAVLITNGNDHTINSDMAKANADTWERDGVTMTRYEFDASLGLPHDYIDMTAIGDKSTWIYPILIDLIENG